MIKRSFDDHIIAKIKSVKTKIFRRSYFSTKRVKRARDKICGKSGIT